MLSWLSHDASCEQVVVHDDDEPPETPAHIFPVRAFKHAIFGTPAPPKTDRRPNHSRAQERPRSRDNDIIPSSPTKRPHGILVTPGTAGQKRKTVSFGGNGEGNDRNDPTGAVSADTPTKYLPNTLVKTEGEIQPTKPRQAQVGSNLEGRKDPVASEVLEEITSDVGAPRSASGRYWKGEFETYTTSTERQMKKLAKKEQVAKKYAQLKVSESQQLAEDLKQEQARAVELERKVEEFRRQLQRHLQSSGVHNTGGNRDIELEHLRKENELLRAQLKAQSITPMELPSSNYTPMARSPDRPLLNRATTEPTTATPPAQHSPALGHPRRRPHNPRKPRSSSQEEQSDIWADTVGSNVLTVKPEPTKPRRRDEREPLAQRNENQDSRSSSTAGIVGAKQSLSVPEGTKDVLSRSSSTQGILGSRQSSSSTADVAMKQAYEKKVDAPKKSELTADRRDAARKRIEERRKNRQKANGAATNA